MATMNTSEEIAFKIEIFDNQDPPQPAVVDGVPVYTSSDEAVLTVVLDDPAVGLSGKFVSVAKGSAFVTVSADADLGAGVTTITDRSEDVAVTPDPALLQATGFGFTLNAPTPKKP